jgi:hypothetical protein
MKTLLLILFLSLTAVSQTTVSQNFLDTANKAFVEVAALREENAALKTALKAQVDLVDALTEENLSKDILLIEKNALIFLKDSLIESQNKTIQKLEERDAIRIAEITALRKLKCDKDVWLGGIYKKIRCR